MFKHPLDVLRSTYAVLNMYKHINCAHTLSPHGFFKNLVSLQSCLSCANGPLWALTERLSYVF